VKQTDRQDDLSLFPRGSSIGSILHCCCCYHAIRTTHFFFCLLPFFFCWSHSQTPGLCLAKELLVFNLCYTTWARILSDYNIFCTLKGERTTVESIAYGTFLVVVSNSGCCCVKFWLFNPLSPKSDKHLLFPDSIAS